VRSFVSGRFVFGISVVAAMMAMGWKAEAQQTPPSSAAEPQEKPKPAAPPVSSMPPLPAAIEKELKDWPNLERFRDANAALPAAAASVKRVVFMGDSITEAWLHEGVPATEPNRPEFFPGKPYVNRGISGQTTPQMLVRFRPDVIALKPAAVVIFAGTNDVAGNTGEMSPEDTENNISSMADLAHANGVKVILCSILPAFDFAWRPGRTPAPKIVALNEWIKSYAASHGYVYVDFHTAMADARGGLPATLSKDGVHPNKSGYAIMDPLVEAGIAKALGGE
jgi:lysophospholipase L1-like esterase